MNEWESGLFIAFTSAFKATVACNLLFCLRESGVKNERSEHV